MPRPAEPIKASLAPLERLVVSLAEAAAMLDRAPDSVSQLIEAGLLGTVPGLDKPGKRAIAVAELRRFASTGLLR